MSRAASGSSLGAPGAFSPLSRVTYGMCLVSAVTAAAASLSAVIHSLSFGASTDLYTKHDVNQIAYTGIKINLPPAFLGKGREERRVRVRHVPLRVPVGTVRPARAPGVDLYPWTRGDLRGDRRREPPLAQRRVPTEPASTLATLLTKHDVSRIDYTMIKKNLPGTPPTGTRYPRRRR